MRELLKEKWKLGRRRAISQPTRASAGFFAHHTGHPQDAARCYFLNGCGRGHRIFLPGLQGCGPRISRKMPIASLTTTEVAEICAMGFDVGEGHITAASYFFRVSRERQMLLSSLVTRSVSAMMKSTNMCVGGFLFSVISFREGVGTSEHTRYGGSALDGAGSQL